MSNFHKGTGAEWVLKRHIASMDTHITSIRNKQKECGVNVESDLLSIEMSMASIREQFQNALDEAMDNGYESMPNIPKPDVDNTSFQAGDRVKFKPGCKPEYLWKKGIEGTVVSKHNRKRQGKDQYMVKIESTPEARRFAGVTTRVPVSIMEKVR